MACSSNSRSAVNAVTCAVDLQQKMAVADDGAGRRIGASQFRIGINLGDVVVEDDDIYGDGVVIAVRLQAVSEPGGICISAGVHEQVRKEYCRWPSPISVPSH